MISLALYGLLTLWVIGVAFAIIATVTMVWRETNAPHASVAACLMIPIGVLAILIAFALVERPKTPNLVTLKKGEWLCTASHRQPITTITVVGKVVVPNTTTVTICDQYSRTSS